MSNKFQGGKVSVVFELLRNFVWFAAGKAKPGNDEIIQKTKPIQKILEEIAELKDSKKGTPTYNHLCAIADGIPAVGWINVVSF